MASKPKTTTRRRSSYDPTTKAAAIAALLAGQSVDRVAADYHIPKGTIEGWKSKLKVDSPVVVSEDAKVVIGEMLLEYLRENLITLRTQQATTFRDTNWLRQQNAADLAILHGVAVDKAVRLLEAMSAAGLKPDAESPPSVTG